MLGCAVLNPPPPPAYNPHVLAGEQYSDRSPLLLFDASGQLVEADYPWWEDRNDAKLNITTATKRVTEADRVVIIRDRQQVSGDQITDQYSRTVRTTDGVLGGECGTRIGRQ